jgi:hypothetical protein
MPEGFLMLAAIGAGMIGFGVYLVGLYLVVDTLLDRLS